MQRAAVHRDIDNRIREAAGLHERLDVDGCVFRERRAVDAVGSPDAAGPAGPIDPGRTDWAAASPGAPCAAVSPGAAIAGSSRVATDTAGATVADGPRVAA